MGPRSFDRGERARRHRPALPGCCLQWGRGHLTAESRARPHGHRHRPDGPSMGPRSFDRGEAEKQSRYSKSHPSLQWGRGHLTAERRSFPWVREWSACLQWGRGHLTAESLSSATRSSGGAVPSMGPRSFDRGEVIDPDPMDTLIYPSMGPRSFDRGEFLRCDGINCIAPTFNGAAVI